MVPDLGGFADDHPGAVIDEEMGPDLRAGMNIRPGAFVGVFSEHPRNQRNMQTVEFMSQALDRDDQDTGVGEDDLLQTAGGGISEVGGFDVGLDDPADLRKGAEEGDAFFFSDCDGFGMTDEAHGLRDILAEAFVNGMEPLLGRRGHLLLGQGGLLEEPRKKQVHHVRGEAVDRLLRRQIHSIEVVDPSIGGVGFEEGGFDLVQCHGMKGEGLAAITGWGLESWTR